MPKVVLHYFTFKGLGEGVRMLLAYGGQEFEDHRIDRDTEWEAFRHNMPFGKVPVLEIDGKQLAQSYAICRYLGRKYGLSGNTAEEEAEIDQNMDLYKEIWSKGDDVFYQPDEAMKEKIQAQSLESYYPDRLKRLDDIVAKNNGHIALGRLTWGDFVFAGMFDNHKRILMMPDLYDKYPNLKRVYDNVLAIPKVKASVNASDSPKCKF